MAPTISTPRLPILLLITSVISIHLLLAHYIFNLPINPLLLPEPLRSLLILSVISFLLFLLLPLLAHRIFLLATKSSFTGDAAGKEAEQWWENFAILLQWISGAFLWDVILGMDRTEEEKWMSAGVQGVLMVFSIVVQILVAAVWISLLKAGSQPPATASRENGDEEETLPLHPIASQNELEVEGGEKAD